MSGITEYSGIVALIISAITVILALRRSGFEHRKLGAETDKLHEEAADAAARRATGAETRLDAAQANTVVLQTEMRTLRDRTLQLELADIKKTGLITALQAENGKLRELITALTCQGDELKAENTQRLENVTQLTAQIVELKAEIVALRAENAALRELVTSLNAQVTGLGGDPGK